MEKTPVEQERERIHGYIRILVSIGDLKVNDGVLLWDTIQDTLPIKYGQVGLALKMEKKPTCLRQ
ncbi:hypothetical protein LCGC14_0420230 [marine sediment metagenome]|uniref:Uncharacterized protein n=1 Tax=marine sediment metagenome TaxID=412755 RepID=A0A0F9SX21_9ZZZZ